MPEIMPEEQVREEPEVQVPPFYERFQEERDKRFSSEIARLEAEIRREMQTQFRWMIGLLLPVILGVVAILIQNLLSP